MVGTMVAPLHVVTPCIYSGPLSEITGADVYLKLENTQPSGSFKLRGVGLDVQRAVAAGATEVLASSGGNAGLAAAYASKKLGVPCTVVVPVATSPTAIHRLQLLGATVIKHGDSWNEAHARCLEILDGSNSFLAHPYDGDTIWEGNSSIVDELSSQLDGIPDTIALSVGGGGLCSGVLKGLRRHKWDTRILAMETTTANCFNESFTRKEHVRIPPPKGVATSLAATLVAQKLFEDMLTERERFRSEVIPDGAAIDACLRFLDDHHFLVEPACGTAISAAYRRMFTPGETVVIIICGGVCVDVKQLLSLREKLAPEMKTEST